MANIPSPSVCPDCGASLPPESPHELCAACLLRQALASRTITGEGPSGPIAAPLTPEEIANRFPGFEILECLGRGGMGVVYKARQKSLDRAVAIKILAPEKHGEERFAERFAREAATLAKLSHPNIVTIHDFGETDGLFFIVMEYVDGVNLRDLVSGGKLAPEQALAIVPPICDALQYAHEKGVVHRDIKPENILLDRGGRVRIADFGIAALMGGPGEPAGTPPYAAPEQTVPDATADHRADIHALGVVFYEMLTGERPTQEMLAPSKRADTDSRLDEMVLRAMAKNPAERFQTAAEFRTVLDSLAAAPEPVVNRRSMRRWVHPAVTVFLLGVVAFLSWKLANPPAAPNKFGQDDEKQETEPKLDVSTMPLEDYGKLRNLTVEEAVILLGRAREELKSEGQRAQMGCLVVSMLCNRGHEEEAWNLISPEMGKFRELQVAGWFASCRVSLKERLERIGTLKNSTEREHAFRVLFNNSSNVDEICNADFLALPIKSNEERSRTMAALYNVIEPYYSPRMKAADRIKLLDKCLNLTAEGWLSPTEGQSMFRVAGDRSAFEQWELVERKKWDLPENGYKVIRDQIIKNMAAGDPERAIRTLVSDVPAKQRYSFLAIVYQKMHEDAPGTCVEKVKALLPEMDDTTVQQLSECVIREALRAGELELAKEWMARISSGKLRVEFAEAYASAVERTKSDLKQELGAPDAKAARPR